MSINDKLVHLSDTKLELMASINRVLDVRGKPLITETTPFREYVNALSGAEVVSNDDSFEDGTLAKKLVRIGNIKHGLLNTINTLGGNLPTNAPFRKYPEIIDYVAWSENGGMLGLFANGEQGAWYDPSDILSYRKLGSELVANGEFKTGVEGWTPQYGATIGWENGCLKLTSSVTTTQRASTSISCVVGKTYEIRALIWLGTATGDTGIAVADNAQLNSSIVFAPTRSSSPTEVVAVFIATSATMYIGINDTESQIGSTSYMKRISVRELNVDSTKITMFQDALGTTPVTAMGDPVGLILDKSRGLVLGNETAPPTSSTTGWPTIGGTLSSNGTSLTITNTSSTEGHTVIGTNLQIGKWYLIRFVTESSTASSSNKGAITLFGVRYGLGTLGQKEFRVRCTGSAGIQFGTNSGVTGDQLTIRDVSVRELDGHHARQDVSASRPTLNMDPVLSNQELVQNGTFNVNSAWSLQAGWTISDGKLRATSVPAYQASTANILSAPIKQGRTYLVEYTIESITGSVRAQYIGNGNAASSPISTTGRHSVIYTPSVDHYSIGFQAVTNNTSLVVDNVSVREIINYSRPHLAFDGIDDFLSTPAIDFTSTDKVSVFAGVRKLSDAATAVLMEFSTAADTAQGAFNLLAPSSGGTNKYMFFSRGTAQAPAATTRASFAAPHNAVLCGIGAIAQRLSELRVNGETVATSSLDQGSVTYGNHVLYIGRRAGTSMPFKGHLYGLTIIGRRVTTNETGKAEHALATLTGVTL